MANMELIGSIQRIDTELTEQKSKVKTINREIKDYLISMDEFKAVEEAQTALKVARAKLEQALLSDSSYAKLVAELNDQKFSLADLKEIMSHHLVSYFGETKQTTVPDAQGENRQIELTGKLGKVEAPASVSMFAQAAEKAVLA